MINLLPPEEKEKLYLEKKKRLVIILWLLVLFFLLCLILVLFSIKVFLQVQIQSQKTLLEEVGIGFKQSETRDFQKKINRINLRLEKLTSFYQQKIYFSDILEKISNTLPQGVYLTNLSITRATMGEQKKTEKEGGIKISLSGFAPTVESLYEFRKNLEKENDFQNIYFPPANWVKLTDINFSISFAIEK